MTPEFVVSSGPTTLAVELYTNVDNAWAGVDSALVDTQTGEVREFGVDAEYYHGTTDGESWTEGDPNGVVYLSRVPPGRYTMRFVGSWQPYSGPGAINLGLSVPAARVRVVEGERSPACLVIALILVVLPLAWSVVRRFSFEKRRWESSNLSRH